MAENKSGPIGGGWPKIKVAELGEGGRKLEGPKIYMTKFDNHPKCSTLYSDISDLLKKFLHEDLH